MRSFATSWTRRVSKAPPITARGPRRAVIQLSPALPYLGPFSSKAEGLLARELNLRGIRYIPQVQMEGGRNVAGGTVVDFLLMDYQIWLRVQGEYWHSSASARARDDLQKIMLEAGGDHYRVVDIWVNAIMRDVGSALDAVIGRLP